MRRTRASHEVLLRLCEELGLDVERARAILASDEYADEVRERERFYQEQGISAVPSVIIDDRHLIQGGQPPEAFERACAAGGRGQRGRLSQPRAARAAFSCMAAVV